MGEQLLFWIICTVAGGAIAIIGYFLKRTIDRQDKVENDVNKLKENAVTEADFKELTAKVQELCDKFVSKEEMRELKESIEKIRTSIDDIKDNTVREKDFIRSITRLESMLDNRH